MGECAYYFKAQFPTPKAAKEARPKALKLLRQMVDAYDYYQGVNSENKSGTIKEFKTKFPLVWEYLTIGFPDETFEKVTHLSGKLDFCNNKEDIQLDDYDGVLSYQQSDIWHFTTWAGLVVYFEEKLGAVKAVWDNEENGVGSLDLLHLYDWEEIVSDILEKADLHTLLGVNSELDTMIEGRIKK
jgi:hypothetical protein